MCHKRNQPFGTGVVARMLELVIEEAELEDKQIAGEYFKFGAAAALALCASLRGSKVFLLDLGGLWKYWELGKEGIMPSNSMKTGLNLLNAPHVIATLIGQFKGELGTRHHLIALASSTTLVIQLRWWLEKLTNLHAREGCKTGLVFGNRDRSVGLMLEYNKILHNFLRRIQAEEPNLISLTDEININYNFLQSFRRTVEGRA
jgi:hypothetical protein